MVAPTQRLFVLVALALALSACGEATLGVRLVEMEGDHPFDVVARLETVAIVDDTVVERTSVAVSEDSDGGHLALDPIPRDGGLRLLVTGYGADDVVTAAGAAAPQLPARDGSCCVRICFCTLALYDNDACSCGSDSCSRCP